jgi:hypothetical protein
MAGLAQVEERKGRPKVLIKKSTRVGKRVAALEAAFLKELGRPKDIITQTQVRAVAELTVMLEQRRADMLRTRDPSGKSVLSIAELETQLRRKMIYLGLGDRPNRFQKPTKSRDERILDELEGRD